jgi:DNA-binding transcriptional MerR regulator
MVDLTIGDLARATGCKIPTIRYYEGIGLMPAPRRSAGNQRLYGAEHLARLAFIRNGRDLGFSQAAIRDLLALADQPDQPCHAVDAITRRHILEIEQRIERLSALRAELEHVLAQCARGKIADCNILDSLARRAANDAPT